MTFIKNVEALFQEAPSKLLKIVRIIRPHHPLFGKTLPVVRIWKQKKKDYYIIELPDKSHTQIPLHWADEGETPLPENECSNNILTANSVKELIFLISNIKNDASEI